MQGNGLLLPSGILPPIRGNAAASSNFSSPDNLSLVQSNSSTSGVLVKDNGELAREMNQAYLETALLTQAAAIASPSSTSSSRMKRAQASSNMFIKTKPRKTPTKKTDLEALLDRNRNLLKSREVCRLLSASQLEKLKNDTIQLEKKLQAKNDEGLDQVMKGLKVEDGDSEVAASDRLSSVSVPL
jgi:hypothetical protein